MTKTPKEIRSSEQWAKARRAAFLSNPVCPDPFGIHDGVVTPATEVHHSVPLTEAPDLAFFQYNLIPLCRSCHERAEGFSCMGVALARPGEQHALSSALSATLYQSSTGEGWVKSLCHGDFPTVTQVKKSAHDQTQAKPTGPGEIAKVGNWFFIPLTRARECLPLGCSVYCQRMGKKKAHFCPACR